VVRRLWRDLREEERGESLLGEGGSVFWVGGPHRRESGVALRILLIEETLLPPLAIFKRINSK